MKKVTTKIANVEVRHFLICTYIEAFVGLGRTVTCDFNQNYISRLLVMETGEDDEKVVLEFEGLMILLAHLCMEVSFDLCHHNAFCLWRFEAWSIHFDVKQLLLFNSFKVFFFLIYLVFVDYGQEVNSILPREVVRKSYFEMRLH